MYIYNKCNVININVICIINTIVFNNEMIIYLNNKCIYMFNININIQYNFNNIINIFNILT